MENIHIQTTHNVTLHYAIASVGDRILATLIDWLFFVAYFIFVFVLIDILNLESDVTVYFMLLPIAIYHLLLEIINNGQSFGKKIMQIKVMRADGAEASLSNYLIRWIFRLVDITLFSGMVAIVSILMSNKGQRLGDMAAGTTVVKLNKQDNPYPQFLKKIPDNYQLAYPQSSKISEKDIKIIANVLQQFRSNRSSPKNNELIGKAKLAAEKLMDIQVQLHPELFLQKVINDYNFLHKSELQEVTDLLRKTSTELDENNLHI